MGSQFLSNFAFRFSAIQTCFSIFTILTTLPSLGSVKLIKSFEKYIDGKLKIGKVF